MVRRIALWSGQAPDVTLAATRDKFFDGTTGLPVDPATSVGEYGTPFIDFYGEASVWNAGTNHGSGGAMTMSGAVSDA